MSGYQQAIPQGTTKFYDDDCPSPRAVTTPYTITWLYPIFYEGTTTPPNVSFNLQQLISQNQIKGVQSVYIDNSGCTQPVAIVDSAGISQIVPALAQAYLPLRYTSNGTLTINLLGPGTLGLGNDAQYGQTIVSFLNYKTHPKIWNSQNRSAAGQFSGQVNNYNASFGVRQDGELVDVWTSGNAATPQIVGASASQLGTKAFNATSAPEGVVITEITGGYFEIEASTYTAYGGYLSVFAGATSFSGTQQFGQYNFAFGVAAAGPAIFQIPQCKVSMYLGPLAGDFGVPGTWTYFPWMCVNGEFSTPASAAINFKALIQAKGKIL